MKKLRIQAEGHNEVLYYDSHLALQAALGSLAKITTTRDGYRIIHPLAPNHPITARWVEYPEAG